MTGQCVDNLADRAAADPAAPSEKHNDSVAPLYPTYSLPTEVWSHILAQHNFGMRELVGVRHVCRYWRDTIDSAESVMYSLERTFQDCPQPSPEPHKITFFKITLKGEFKVSKLRTLHWQWQEALARARAVVQGEFAPGQGPRASLAVAYRQPDLLACQDFCALVDWDTLEEVALDFSSVEENYFVNELAERQRLLVSMRTPYALCQALKNAVALRILHLIDVDPHYIDADLARLLASSLQDLSIKSCSHRALTVGGPIDAFVRTTGGNILGSVKTLSLETYEPSEDMDVVFHRLCNAIKGNVKKLSLIFPWSENDFETRQQPDATRADVCMEQLEDLAVAMDTNCGLPLKFRLLAPSLHQATLSSDAFEFFRLSADALFGSNLCELVFDARRYIAYQEEFIYGEDDDDSLNDTVTEAVSTWTHLTNLSVILGSDTTWADQVNAITTLLECLSDHPHVPLKSIYIAGCDEWDALSLVRLVCSRMPSNCQGDDSVQVLPVEKLTITGTLRHNSTFDMLKGAVQDCVWQNVVSE